MLLLYIEMLNLEPANGIKGELVVWNKRVVVEVSCGTVRVMLLT